MHLTTPPALNGTGKDQREKGCSLTVPDYSISSRKAGVLIPCSIFGEMLFPNDNGPGFAPHLAYGSADRFNLQSCPGRMNHYQPDNRTFNTGIQFQIQPACSCRRSPILKSQTRTGGKHCRYIRKKSKPSPVSERYNSTAR